MPSLAPHPPHGLDRYASRGTLANGTILYRREHAGSVFWKAVRADVEVGDWFQHPRLAPRASVLGDHACADGVAFSAWRALIVALAPEAE